MNAPATGPARPLVVVTTNLRSFAPANVLESHAAAAARWGARHVVVDEEPPGWLEGGLMAFLLRVHAELKHPFGARVLALDADVVLRADCPSYFALVPDGCVGGVCNDQGDTHPPPDGMAPHIEPFLEQLAAVDAEAVRFWRERCVIYVNGGVLVYEPDLHAPLFARALELCRAVDPHRTNPALQQTAINVCAARESVACLPRQFGRLGAVAWGEAGRAYDRPHAMCAYAYHLARIFGLREEDQRRARLATLDWRDVSLPLEDEPIEAVRALLHA